MGPASTKDSKGTASSKPSPRKAPKKKGVVWTYDEDDDSTVEESVTAKDASKDKKNSAATSAKPAEGEKPTSAPPKEVVVTSKKSIPQASGSGEKAKADGRQGDDKPKSSTPGPSSVGPKNKKDKVGINTKETEGKKKKDTNPSLENGDKDKGKEMGSQAKDKPADKPKKGLKQEGLVGESNGASSHKMTSKEGTSKEGEKKLGSNETKNLGKTSSKTSNNNGDSKASVSKKSSLESEDKDQFFDAVSDAPDDGNAKGDNKGNKSGQSSDSKNKMDSKDKNGLKGTEISPVAADQQKGNTEAPMNEKGSSNQKGSVGPGEKDGDISGDAPPKNSNPPEKDKEAALVQTNKKESKAIAKDDNKTGKGDKLIDKKDKETSQEDSDVRDPERLPTKPHKPTESEEKKTSDEGNVESAGSVPSSNDDDKKQKDGGKAQEDGEMKDKGSSNAAEKTTPAPNEDGKQSTESDADSGSESASNKRPKLMQSDDSQASQKRQRLKAHKKTGPKKSPKGKSNNDALVLSDQSDDDQDSDGSSVGSTAKKGDGDSKDNMSTDEDEGDRERQRPRAWKKKNRGSGKDDDDDESDGKETEEELLERTRDLEVGERVYAEFPENRTYYWGHIESRIKRKKSRFYLYTVKFDDGDVGEDISRKKVESMQQYRNTLGEDHYKEALAIAKKYAKTTTKKAPAKPSTTTTASQPTAKASENFSGLNLHELLDKACGKCQKCKAKDCGECGACKTNRFGKEQVCCFHKVCLKIPEDKKLQTSKHLPPNIAFCFLEPESNPRYEGLVLVSKGGRRYRALENLTWGQQKPDFVKAYSYLGLKSRYTAKETTNTAASRNESQSSGRSATDGPLDKDVKPYTPRQLLLKGCGKCGNCTKQNCGQCVCCRGSKRDASAKSCCYQKMCLEIDLSLKAQPAYGFPDGWTFAFDLPRMDFEELNGLILIAPPPTSHKYNSAERAVNHCPVKLANVNVSFFYSSIGLPGVAGASGSGASTAGGQKRPAVSGASQLRTKKVRVERQGLSLRQLHDRRCKNCIMCQKPSCNSCEACIHNKNFTRPFKEVCLQKMCIEIDPKDKAQPAKFLAEGWTFYYTDPKKLPRVGSTEHTGLAGLVLLSPGGRSFSSVETAVPYLGPTITDTAEAARSFYRMVGCHATVPVPDHPLLGKGYTQSWIDVSGTKKVIYGKVVGVQNELLLGGTKRYTIDYVETSRALANAAFSQSGVSVPKSRAGVDEMTAFGGCLAHNPNVVRPHETPFYFSWLVPEYRHEDFIVDDDDMWTPRLTLQFRGFHLCLTAKPSTIPNAGKGVFLSCTSLMGDNDIFQLRPGELLDLGVYAPFRREDRKASHVFLLKNFLHGSICEEWNFDTTDDDHLFDITDDSTGKLHDIASRHIPAYVNETDGHITPTVFAGHDPEGCVHYLLGHHRESDDPFAVRADGSEVEIFVDYGSRYEDCRVRKQYSRLPAREAADRLRHLEGREVIEVLEELKTYNASEVTQCIDFMNQNVILAGRAYKASTVARSLIAAVLFRTKAEEFLHAFDQVLDSTDDVCRNGFSQPVMTQAVKKAKKLIRRLYESCNSWANLKQALMSKPQLQSCLEYVLGEKDYHGMSAEDFGALLMGSN